MEPAHAPITLTAAALDALSISTLDAVKAVEKILAAVEQGEAWYAPKSVILPPDDRYAMSTLALATDPPYMVNKCLVVNSRAPSGTPSIHASVTLCEAATGRPLAFIDGDWITAVRTAALSATAAVRMARDDSQVLALVGCGVQARAHLRSFSELFPLTTVKAYSRGATNRDALLREAENMGLDTIACATPVEALDEADVVVTAVSLSRNVEPFLDTRWLAPGAFAAITDLGIPWFPEHLGAFDRIIVDDADQERVSAQPMVEATLIAGDLRDLVSGRTTARQSPEERTAFMFRGLALGDFAVAALAYDRWIHRNL